MFDLIVPHLYIGDEKDAEEMKKNREYLALHKPYIFVDARPFFNLLAGDANESEILIQEQWALGLGLGIMMSHGVTLFIYCQAGIERSPFIATLAMYHSPGCMMTLNECYDLVAKKHPQTIKYDVWMKPWVKVLETT